MKALSFGSCQELLSFLEGRSPEERFTFFYGPKTTLGPFLLIVGDNDLGEIDTSFVNGFERSFSFDLDFFRKVSSSSSLETLGFSIEKNDQRVDSFAGLNNEFMDGRKKGLRRARLENSVYRDCYMEIGVAFLTVKTLKVAVSLNLKSTEGFFFSDSFFDSCPFVEGIPLPYNRSEMRAGSVKKSALFLDRDGIINKDFGYVGSKEKIQFIEGIFPLIRLFKKRGWWVFVVTNQSGVARGLYSEEDVVSLHQWMSQEMAKRSAGVDEWFYCPFHPKACDPLLKGESLFRKPHPGMLLSAAEKYAINLEQSLMIGDKLTDVINLKGLSYNLISGRYSLEGASAPCFQSHEELINYYLNVDCRETDWPSI